MLYCQICILYFLFIYFIVEYLKKIFMYYLIINSIEVYCTIIILNTLHKMVYYMKLKIVKDWSTLFEVNWLVILNCYFCFLLTYIIYVLYNRAFFNYTRYIKPVL